MVEKLNAPTSRRLPPLNALRAFEAAARHGSLSKAADELGVTPGAVSQQIRQLEEVLGLALFRRHARGVELTEEAAAALPALSDAFDRMRQAIESFAGVGDQTRVRLGAPAGFARKWLVPRLVRFEAESAAPDRPPTRVVLATDAAPGDLDRLRLDVDIRFGPGDHGGLEARRLLTETVSPAAAPSLLADYADGRDALARAPLLHDVGAELDPATPDWTRWLTAAGVRRAADGGGGSLGDRLTQSDHVVDAAVAGRGVGLVRRMLAADDIAAGRLETILVGGVTELAWAYDIVWPKGRRLGAAAKDVIDFVLAEAAPFEHMGV